MRFSTTDCRQPVLIVAILTLSVSGLLGQSSSGSQQPPAGSAPPPTGGSASPPTAQEQQERERSRQSGRTPRTSRRQPSPSLRESERSERTSRNELTRQEVALTVNFLGGHDDNLVAGTGTGGGQLPGEMLSGTTGFLDTSLDYFRGNSSRFLRVASTGNLRTYPGHMGRPAAGALLNVEARTDAGQNLTLGGSERAGYEPMFSVFAPSDSAAPLLPGIGESSPDAGLFQRRAFRSESAAFLEHRLSPRDSTTVSYAYQKQQFFDDAGNSSSHNVTADYRKRLTTLFSVSADYRYVRGEYFDNSAAVRPRREHRLEAGAELVKRFSRRRRLSLSIEAGATRFESLSSVTDQSYGLWAPVGSGRATFELSPQWSLDGGYTRRFTLLQGLTDEAYATDSAYVAAAGPVTARTFLTLDATYSNGRTPIASGVDSTFDVYGLSAQVRVGITQMLAATAGYVFYHHSFSHPQELSFGIPAEYNRQALRVGLTLWVPLAGAPPTPLLAQR